MIKVKLTLIQGDCLKVLPTLPRESVDLVLTDPPYGIGNRTKLFQGKKRELKEILIDFDSFPDEEAFKKFTSNWISECVRILKPNCNFVSFMDAVKLQFVRETLEKFGFKYRNVLYWIKSNPPPHLRKVNFAFGVETLLWMSRGKNVFNYQLGHSPNYYVTKCVAGDYPNPHPTKKPVELIEWIIKYLSNEGDTVLDPFLGSGTTMIACRNLKRNCIGIEINPEYIEITKKRLNWGSSLSNNIEWEVRVVE